MQKNISIFESDDAVALLTSDETRQIIADYIQAQGTINPYTDGNWKIADVEGNPNVIFLSNSNGVAELSNFPKVIEGESKGSGLTEYRYSFN